MSTTLLDRIDYPLEVITRLSTDYFYGKLSTFINQGTLSKEEGEWQRNPISFRQQNWVIESQPWIEDLRRTQPYFRVTELNFKLQQLKKEKIITRSKIYFSLKHTISKKDLEKALLTPTKEEQISFIDSDYIISHEEGPIVFVPVSTLAKQKMGRLLLHYNFKMISNKDSRELILTSLQSIKDGQRIKHFEFDLTKKDSKGLIMKWTDKKHMKILERTISTSTIPIYDSIEPSTRPIQCYSLSEDLIQQKKGNGRNDNDSYMLVELPIGKFQLRFMDTESEYCEHLFTKSEILNYLLNFAENSNRCICPKCNEK